MKFRRKRFQYAALCFGSLLLLLLFQNCSPGKFQASLDSSSSLSSISGSDPNDSSTATTTTTTVTTTTLSSNTTTTTLPQAPVTIPQFKSISVLKTDEYVAKPQLNQRVEFQLHASGGGDDSFGTSYRAITPIEMGYKDNMPFEFRVVNAANYDAPPFIGVRPRDYILKENGHKLETWWFGYYHQAPEGSADQTAYAHNYTEIRLDALYEWFFKNHPQANPKQVVLKGQSMGAWGSMTYGLRRAQKFAAIFCTLPRWRQTTVPNLHDVPVSTVPNSGGLPYVADLKLPSGEKYKDRMDMIAFVSNPNNEIPFVAWAIGKQDGYASWESQIEAVNALRATKRGFVLSWNNGNHSEGVEAMKAVTATYDVAQFEIGKGYPVLMNSSLDNDLVNDPVGGINLGFKWRNLVETSDKFEFEISNSLGEVSVDVMPHSVIYKGRSIKKITIPAGQWIKVTFN